MYVVCERVAAAFLLLIVFLLLVGIYKLILYRALFLVYQNNIWSHVDKC